ncbi:M20 metallopeptidase family protein [Garciella nitratireducens]|uniref:Amidohydrolase n=1 Tax=Garciella nitratireducens DSM 15102 TaxID=1121911 RepID=A0A1T4KYF9_9FIRM|nr:M20 family metallopeptidase [Garciella nitratireducens]RBP38959.1 amidohydrolase [Garciella nitratireducens]SJZ47466.1 amidohydrolase [Garciella nitratireducens DSM 15102]
MLTKEIQKLSEDFYEEIVSLRHCIHENPEIGFQEFQTAQLIIDTLEKYGIEYQSGIAKTGVVGVIKGKNPGKTVLLRADMDALILQEETYLSYASKVNNRMHACGHDGHTAGLLGTAIILNSLKEYFDGTVKLMFQPAEETEGGALPMIEEGVLENPKVDAAFACHLWGNTPEGKVEICHGPMMAACDCFELKIKGIGGHGAMPHLTVDPISIAAYIITMLQSVVSRRMDPLEPVVLSIGSINGGDGNNIIPDSVKITGTVRTLNEKVHQQIPKEMENIIKGVCDTYGANYDFYYQREFPVLINDSAMTDLAGKAFSKILGEENVKELEKPYMGGEDFAYLAQRVPSSFAYIGISKDMDHPILHHNPKFKFDDKNLKILSQGLAQIAVDFLKK